MKTDIHVHSEFSEDSDSPMEAMADAAVAAGVEALAFTDHLDYDFPEELPDFTFDVPPYIEKLRRMQEEYEGRLKILIGVELGMQPQVAEKCSALLDHFPIDYAIGSQHLVWRKDPYYPETFEGRTDAEVFRAYFEEMLSNLKVFDAYDSLGHLDYVVRCGMNGTKEYSYGDFSDVIDEILRTVISKGKALEVNTAGLRKGLGFAHPHPDVLRRYRELGGSLVTMGSDAHAPSDVAADMDAAAEVLRALGFKSHVYFEKHVPIEVPLP